MRIRKQTGLTSQTKPARIVQQPAAVPAYDSRAEDKHEFIPDAVNKNTCLNCDRYCTRGDCEKMKTRKNSKKGD